MNIKILLLVQIEITQLSAQAGCGSTEHDQDVATTSARRRSTVAATGMMVVGDLSTQTTAAI